jgi:hypothetical protein
MLIQLLRFESDLDDIVAGLSKWHYFQPFVWWSWTGFAETHWNWLQVVTFWEGEIVDNKNYTFYTGKWEAT